MTVLVDGDILTCPFCGGVVIDGTDERDPNRGIVAHLPPACDEFEHCDLSLLRKHAAVQN